MLFELTGQSWWITKWKVNIVQSNNNSAYIKIVVLYHKYILFLKKSHNTYTIKDNWKNKQISRWCRSRVESKNLVPDYLRRVVVQLASSKLVKCKQTTILYCNSMRRSSRYGLLATHCWQLLSHFLLNTFETCFINKQSIKICIDLP